MGTPLSTVKQMVTTDHGLGKKLLGSYALMVIEGYETLSFLMDEAQLPMLQGGTLEHSSPTGNKMSQPTKPQTQQKITLSLNERNSQIAKNMAETILMCGINGDLVAKFYTGDGDQVGTKLWGEGILGVFEVEGSVDFSTESAESALKIGGIAFSCHYFPATPTLSDAMQGEAIGAIGKYIGNSGSDTGVSC